MLHVLIVTDSFPSPAHPYRATFVGEQVKRLLDHVDRITVLSPTAYVPRFVTVSRVARQASLPLRYEFVRGRCEVLFPRYLKAPGYVCLWWTAAQWCRIVSRTVCDLLETGTLSLIHANKGGVSSWSAIQAARHYNLPCVVTYQGTEIHTHLVNREKEWKLCRDSFRFADLNISVSRSLEDILKSCAETQGRCEVLLRGVDLKTFFPPQSERMRQSAILFVGAVGKTKGAFDLLEAWPRVLARCTNAKLWFVGPDYTNGRFVRAVQSRRHDNSVKILGPQTLDKVADLMRQAQVLCLPSHGEGTPNCIMEAMACGLAVVATEVGGIPDIVETGRTGMLVHKGDIQGLANTLASLLQDSGRCARMGEAAHAFARKHLDSQKTTSRLVELYQDLIVTSQREQRPKKGIKQ